MAQSNKLYSIDLEKRLIASLITYPEKYFDISAYIGPEDFYSEESQVHKTIFSVLKRMIEGNETVDGVILAERISSLGISFKDEIPIGDYIEHLSLRKTNPNSIVSIAKELKKLSIRRKLCESADAVKRNMMSLPSDASYEEIIRVADEVFNKSINLYEGDSDVPENIYDDLEADIEDRGNNPRPVSGFYGPFPKVNDIYGPILKDGNICVIVARSGSGKMQPLWSKILTPNGWRKMGELYVGCEVVTPKGVNAKVTHIFNHYQKEVYKVALGDGRETHCGIEHLWAVVSDTGSVEVIDTQEVINRIEKGERVELPSLDESVDQFPRGLNNVILSVEKIDGKHDCRCISIQDEDHLYITDDYIVTHNTNIMLNYATEVSFRNNHVPILHLDNGEMSKEELQLRQCSALSGVPLYLLESGDWRRAGQEIVDQVRAVWKKIKGARFYYKNVAGMSVEQMTAMVRRFYFSKVGRGNKMILSFDYFKTTGQQQSGVSEWALVGEMMDKFKQLIHKEILDEGKPVISMMSAIQANRAGIVRGKTSDNILDDESIVSLSDRITHFCSHMFILRPKLEDEIVRDGKEFGTHKLVCIKHRHLGKDIAGALEKIPFEGRLYDNSINLKYHNFTFEERGDFRDVVRKFNAEARTKGVKEANSEEEIDELGFDDDLPKELR